MFELNAPISFEWDEGNSLKNLTKHGISCEKCEGLFLNLPLVLIDNKHSATEQRYWALGEVDSDYLHITFTMRNNRIRVISTRSMSRKEKEIYEKTKRNTNF